jgi:serine/threonine-protein kinase
VTPLNPGDRLDHYNLDELVAKGGMASVFRATDSLTGEQVAIKVPHPEAECDPVFFDRFRREAAIGRELDHPAVLKVLPAVRSKRVYMAAEWVEGTSLRKILDTEGKLPKERAVRLAISLCETLEYIHEQGVAHRDLKPENIIVGKGDSIKLLDFGIAAKAGARRLTFGSWSKLMGTADYISPEQLKGKRGDSQSDLYALGVILYEMLTGAAPFEGMNPFVVMNQRLIADPDMFGIPEELRAVIRCAMQRDPVRRYADAREFAQDLKRPAEARNAERRMARQEPRKAVLFSLAMIPAGIFLLMMLVAQHQ